MSPKSLRRLATLLLVALVVWVVLALARRSGGDRPASLSLPKIDTAAVDTIALTGPRDTSIIARTTSGRWRVNGYPASLALVTELLTAFRDSSAWSELAAERRGSHERFGVAADSARRLRVTSHGRVLLDVLTGKRTADWGGFYVRRPTEDAVYAFHGALASALSRGPDDWRDKQIVAVTPASVDTIHIQRGARGYVVRRSGNGWAFAGGGAADSAAVADLLGAYQDLAATGFATRAEAAALPFSPPRRRAQLMAHDGRTLASLVFDSTATGVWIRADSGGTVFRTDAWTMNRLTPADSTLRVPKRARP